MVGLYVHVSIVLLIQPSDDNSCFSRYNLESVAALLSLAKSQYVHFIHDDFFKYNIFI